MLHTDYSPSERIRKKKSSLTVQIYLVKLALIMQLSKNTWDLNNRVCFLALRDVT